MDKKKAPMPSEKGRLRFVGTAMKGENSTSRRTISSEYFKALDELSGYPHVIVLCWLYMNDGEEQRSISKVKPKRHKDEPEFGVFACRSQVRPDPTDLYVSKLLGVNREYAYY